jgi:hypothetical protein
MVRLRDVPFMHRPCSSIWARGYLYIMQFVRMRRWNAMLLLALMAFFALPRTWFHECHGTAAQVMVPGNVVVHTDDQCLVCDKFHGPLVADAMCPVVERTDVAIGTVLLPAGGTVRGSADIHCSRGPPSLA